MCGISAIIGSNNITEEIMNIILEQDIRGKDATGLAYLDIDKGFYIFKKAEEPKVFFKNYYDILKERKEHIVIGHNRQATSGLNKHSDEEAHPFISEDGSFVLVHNGHIIGYSSIMLCLEELYGHNFSTTVDTESAVHLLEDALQVKKDRYEAIKFLSYCVSGTMLILFSDGELYVISDNGACYIAQDKNNKTIYIASTLFALQKSLQGKIIDLYHYGECKQYRWNRRTQAYETDSMNTIIITIKDYKITSDKELKKYSFSLPKDSRVVIATCDFCNTPEMQICLKVQIPKST